MSLARKVQKQTQTDTIKASVRKAISDAKVAVTGTGMERFDSAQPVEVTMPIALRNEALLEQQSALYAAWREFWRDHVTRALSLPPGHMDAYGLQLGPETSPIRGLFAEYLARDNRPKQYLALAPMVDGVKRTLLVDGIEEALLPLFVNFALGLEMIEDLMHARLSGGSKLAFRINTEPVAGQSSDEAGVHSWSGTSPSRPGSGSAHYDPLAFTFAALTDWSRHEPAVTKRARKLFQELPSGLLPPLGNRAANATDFDMLHFQGISKAPATSATRLGEIRASLTQPITGLETSIELPARLILSTSQDAVWLTNRVLPPEITSAGTEPVSAAFRDSIEVLAPRGKVANRGAQRLWAARLDLSVLPGVRAVRSPDLRPMALGGLGPGETLRLPGHGAPPRGPWAPWLLGLEQMESGVLTAEAVPGQDPSSACPPAASPQSKLRLVRWLCERATQRQRRLAQNYRIFRTSVDAYDRHQFVLQTSAWGLPVIGRREQGASVDDPAGLVKDSGQIEQREDYALLDLADGQAIYRPIPFNVQELSLTALGGSFLHDTRFIPAAGATDLYARNVFDGFSIERYQHDIVLGRDVRAEIVYRGYLIPLCHRASLVKLTERIFLLTRSQGIKAILRQRMFLKVGNRLVSFPAIGHPHDGRLWCGKSVAITTTGRLTCWTRRHRSWTGPTSRLTSRRI